MRGKAPAEKSFRRGVVRPGRRKRRLRRIASRAARHGTAVALVAYAVYKAVTLVVTASPLRVTHIVVQGNVRLSNGEVEALVHGLYGRSILTADLDAFRRRLLDSPWVSAATLRRMLPSTIEIHIAERQPIGISRLGSHLYLIDRRGAVIDEFGPEYQDFDLPIIDGLVSGPRNGHPAIDAAKAVFAARVIDGLEADRALARRVSQIDVSDARDAVVLMDDDPALVHLGDDKFLDRLRSYLEVVSTLRVRAPDIDHVDLRFKERVYVRPRAAAPRRTRGRSARTSKKF
jgi:cell division septal protein FtsQ